MFASIALWVVGIVLLVTILWRGIAAHLLWHYPLFYLYIAFTLATSAVRVLVSALYGLASAQYYWAYHIPNFVIAWLLLFVLFEIWRKVEPGDTLWARIRLRPLIFLATAIGVVAIGFTMKEGDPFFRFDAVVLFGQMLTCIFLYGRVCAKRDVTLGGNLKGILSGVGLLVGFQGMNFARFFFADASRETFGFFLQFFYFLALSVFTYSLWSYAPLGHIGPSLRQRIDRVGHDLEKAIRVLLSPR
jgi:hypothetical protein